MDSGPRVAKTEKAQSLAQGKVATIRRGRPVPRSFEFRGRGEIIEEAAYSGTYTEPAIQLLEFLKDIRRRYPTNSMWAQK
jgi:hypothetical protein